MIALLAFATGCSNAPRLDTGMSARARAAAYPALVPLGPLLAGISQEPGSYSPTLLTGNLPARAAALRARAARLRGTVVDTAARDRMRAAIARHAR
ncbi:hypothetical protein [Aliiroseovarius sp.]|uniref:hypothetical protein n=1 Tax=Aliiroseovarius sp. TaxID=1872442 RepID=UPI002620D6A4|nr:hypothetical protein [Aliiroseovarius sp.]